ncbi:MAG: hypothetical protein ABI539_13640 [Acidobacteriota bacterium]
MTEQSEFRAPAELNSIRTIALGIGGIGLIVWAIGLYFDTEQALRSWLLGFILWAGIGFGGIGVLLLQYLTGGAWGVVIRRVAEACARSIPVLLLVFLPIALGMTRLYEWTHLPATDHIMVQRGWFMTPESWLLRSAVYFIIFGVMAYLLCKWSADQDKTDNYEASAALLGRATVFSGPTMVIYCIFVTFASVDWVMTLDPHYFSTIWGLLFVAGWGLSSFCFGVIVLAYMSDKAPMDRVLGRRHFHDIGKLMLALTMIWAYFNFSQFLIIWSGNIPEEAEWFLVRMTGGYGYISWSLVILHFAVPFLILLQQDFKRRAKQLALLAIFMLFMRLVDMFFLIGPTPRIDTHGLAQGAFILSWMDIVAPIAIGGIFVWYFLGQYMSRPLVPVMDPFLENAIEHGHGH